MDSLREMSALRVRRPDNRPVQIFTVIQPPVVSPLPVTRSIVSFENSTAHRPGIREWLLLVEDNDDDYFVSSRQLQKAGIATPHHRCADGQEARDYLSGVGEYADRTTYPLPQLILADLKMPRLNGIELLRWLRTEPTLKRIPFVMLTSSDAPSDVASAYDAFATGYLLKTGRSEEMVDAFRTLRHFWFTLNQPPPLA